MKSFKIFAITAVLSFIATLSFAQTKSETFKVSGNCGMCKSKIEKAAIDAGATTAKWDVESKELTVKYNSASTNTAKIQQKIAGVGYDNAGAKATTESYNKLHGCCKYERNADAKNAKAACCSGDAKCAEHADGNHEAKADCCKDGKCSKEGHNGVDCCKKSD